MTDLRRSVCGIAECPCNDGDPCNYEDHGETKAMPHPDRRQRQDSVTDQLRDVAVMAERAGCYDAADWIRRGLRS